jgi:hypothetical protein
MGSGRHSACGHAASVHPGRTTRVDPTRPMDPTRSTETPVGADGSFVMRNHADHSRFPRRRTATALASIATILASVVAVAATPAMAAPATCFGRPVTIFAVAGVATIGTPGDDVIMGTAGDDVIDGLGGNDRICGGGGDDRISGGPGNDMIHGGPGNDTLLGGPGRDRILGGPGNDTLDGGPGRDVLLGGPGDDTIIGQAGEDVMDGNAGGDVCRTERRTDRVRRCSVERADVSQQVSQLEARMVGQINRLRRNVGVAPLRTSSPMGDVARRWSAGLPSSFVHNPPWAHRYPPAGACGPRTSATASTPPPVRGTR